MYIKVLCDIRDPLIAHFQSRCLLLFYEPMPLETFISLSPPYIPDTANVFYTMVNQSTDKC